MCNWQLHTVNQLDPSPFEKSHHGLFFFFSLKNFTCRKEWSYFLSLNKKFRTVTSCPSHSSPRFRLRTRGTCNFLIPFLVSHRLILLRKSTAFHSLWCAIWIWGSMFASMRERDTDFSTTEGNVLGRHALGVKWGHPELTQGQCHCASEAPGLFPTTRVTWPDPQSHFQFSLGGTRHQHLWKMLPRTLMGSEVWEPWVNQRPRWPSECVPTPRPT